MKRILFYLMFSTLIFAQNARFIIVDELDVTSKSGKDNLVRLVNSLNQLSNIDFVVFNGLYLDLYKQDDLVFSAIKKIKSAVYVLPSSNLFYLDRSAREKFMNLFGDLNFRKNYEDFKIIGLNSTVAWNRDPYFERETLTFLKDQKLDSLSSSILILNSDPYAIKNFDSISKLYNDSKIKFIAAPNKSTKEIIKDKISILNTSVNSRKNEAFKIIDVRNDTVGVRTSGFEGDLSKENIYTFLENSFSQSESTIIEDPGNYLRWNYDVGYSLSAKILAKESKIIIADISGQVVCLDSLGKKLWDYFSFGYIYSKPTLHDGYLAIATIQGDLETINARSGKPIQSLGFDSPITSDLFSFDFAGQYKFMIPKESRSKAAVIAGTENGSLYCYDLETMQEIWHFDKATASIIGQPILINGQIFFYSLDGYLYSVNARTGLLTWKNKLTDKNEHRIYGSNLVHNNESVFISLTNGKIFSYDILLGRKNWEFDKYRLSTTLNISTDGRLLYARSTNDRLHVLSSKLGTWVREVNTRFGNDYSNTDIIEIGNELFYGNDEGYLIGLDQNYKSEKRFRKDNSPLFSITPLSKNKLLLGYHNGTISLIKLGR